MDKKKENILIDEKDLFAFIFTPESVLPEKKEIIESDKSFEEILEFYRLIKQRTIEDVDNKLKNIIAKKISVYSLDNYIRLYPLAEHIVSHQNKNRLAADSTKLEPKLTTKTFVDIDKEYLIKVLNYGGQTKFFVFSAKDEVVKKFDIVIEPHNLKFHFEDNTEPLIIDKNMEADIITLKFESES